MERQAERSRGQPLRLLVLFLAVWIGGRATVWTPSPLLAGAMRRLATIDWLGWIVLAPPAAVKPRITGRITKNADVPVAFALATPARLAISGSAKHTHALPQLNAVPTGDDEPAVSAEPGYSPSPFDADRLLQAPGLKGFSGARSPGRWSLDSWVMIRGGAKSDGPVAGFAEYGGSQAGAVLRYSLDDMVAGAGAYARVSGALDAGAAGYRELAAGLSVQPFSAVPLAVLGEVRVRQSAGETRLHPAVAVITSIPVQTLPMAIRAEVYGQAGYVGGAGATGFFDGQVVLERAVGHLGGNGTINLGAGAWAGGQRGAQRLDVGPEVQVRVQSGRIAGRIALDWRWRIAGNAEPGEGPALTVSMGF